MNLTTAQYWASKDPQLKALLDIKLADGSGNPDIAARRAAASKLNDQGLIVDNQIMIWGWDPVYVMGNRRQLGYPWVPNAFQPDLVNPLGLGSETPTDMRNPWPRSIKVSLDPADYPTLTLATTPIAPPSNVVGMDLGDGTFLAPQAAVTNHQGDWTYNEGDAIQHNGVTLFFHLEPSLFAPEPVWETAAHQSQRLSVGG